MKKRAATAYPLQTREASFVASPGLPEGELDLRWSTGAAVERMDWWTGTRYLEELSLAPGAVVLDELNRGAPLLDAHRGYSSLDVIGNVVDGTAVVDKSEGLCRVRFDMEDPPAVKIYRKAKNKFVRGVSIGYNVHKFEIIPATAGSIERRIAIKWTPREVTICPMGADTGGEIRSRAKQEKTPCEIVYRSQPSLPKGPPPMKRFFKTRKALSVTDAKAKAKEWIALVEGNEEKISDLALEISAFMSGEAAGEEAATEPPAPEGEMSAIEEAAREVTGLVDGPEAKVVSALYKLEMRAGRVTSATQSLGQEQAKARKAKLDSAVTEGRMTPAERKLVERRMAEGKISDTDLDEELALAPKVGPGAPVVEPPAPKDPEAAVRTQPTTPTTPDPKAWEKIVNPEMVAFCEKRSLSLQHFAESWMESNPGKPYVKPSDRNN